MTDLTNYPSLDRLTSRLLERWPDHKSYIDKSFDGRSVEVMDTSEEIAGCALKLAECMEGGLDGLCNDYRFLCEEIVLPEEWHFRRHDRYRLSSFADAMRACYANPPYMSRYMNGLLVSNVLWDNHTHAISSYINEYLPSLPPGSSLLEIGPGHGLFLYFAARNPAVELIAGWDVSPTSIAHTRNALATLGITRSAHLTQQNMFDAKPRSDGARYDAIVMSEILEHLESPVEALTCAARWLRPGGTIWVNVPANSPAPDHIYLVNSPEHAEELVREAGLEVQKSHAFPMTGATLDKARKRKLAISCVVVGRVKT